MLVPIDPLHYLFFFLGPGNAVTRIRSRHLLIPAMFQPGSDPLAFNKVVIGVFPALHHEVRIDIDREVTNPTRTASHIPIYKHRLSGTLSFQHAVTGAILDLAVELSSHLYGPYRILFIRGQLLELP